MTAAPASCRIPALPTRRRRPMRCRARASNCARSSSTRTERIEKSGPAPGEQGRFFDRLAMTGTGPCHEGERAVQRRLGFAEHAETRGGNIRDFMPDQHRTFFAQLPFVVLGALDAVGNPWATILTGEPGFLSSPDPKLLHIAAYPQ